MSTNSKIEWTTHTFNPWRGCTKVSPGCAHCYAETMSKRNPSVLGVWGKNGQRVVAADSYWRQPLAWNKAAAKAGERHRVFCASLADVFEGEDTMPASEWPKVQRARARLFDVIYATPHLDWLLLTKRPENVCRMLGPDGVGLYAHARGAVACPQPNVWIGTSIENQQTADERIPHLLRVPAAVRFLSCEPLLGPVKLQRGNVPAWWNGATLNPLSQLDWVIVGGESGPGARPCDIAWIRSLVSQCEAAAVPVFVKQLGAVPVEHVNAFNSGAWGREQRAIKRGKEHVAICLTDHKGGDMSEWSEDLRVRELPRVPAKGGGR